MPIARSPISREQIDQAVAGQTIVRYLLQARLTRPDEPALRLRESDRSDKDRWSVWSWGTYADAAARVGRYLTEQHGVQPGDRVALMLTNRPEFHPIDLGVALAGAVPISIYNSSAPEQVSYILEHCAASLIIIEESILARVAPALDDVPHLRSRWVIPAGNLLHAPDSTWTEILAAEPLDLAAAADRSTPEDTATVIYTSGTTGRPKGVVLTQANICWTLESLARCLPECLRGREMLSFLPMAHVAERNFTHYLPIKDGAIVTDWADLSTIHEGLTLARPATFFGPPRIWERLWDRLNHHVRTGWDRPDGWPEGTLDIAAADQHAARSYLGLEACFSALTGAAPIRADLVRAFRSIGVPLTEIYGLSEDSGPASCSPTAHRDGAVGQPIPGTEIALAADGEVLLRGGHIFAGYLNDPATTAEVVDADGWLHTGDIGTLDADGYLSIVDRKKELLVTGGGKNVAPTPIEAALTSSPLISQACVVGDGMPYLVALLVLDSAEAQRHADHPDQAVAEAVHQANAGLSRPEQVKRYVVLDEEWTVGADLVTPTLKIKRRQIAKRYEQHISDMYAGGGHVAVEPDRSGTDHRQD